jgi:chitinase
MRDSRARLIVHGIHVFGLAGVVVGCGAASSGSGSAQADDAGGATSEAGVSGEGGSGRDAGVAADGARDGEVDGGHEGSVATDGASEAATDALAPAFGKVVGGYYPNWTPSPVRVRDVDPHYNVIYLFAATPVGGAPGTGAVEWTPPGDGLGAATNLDADIAYARTTQGRKIIMSIGGAGQNMSFPDRATSQTFVDSIASLYAQLGGFDGIDWDTYEGADAPDTSEMIWIGQTLKGMYPGFLVTTPPAPWSTVDQEMASQMVAAGALDYAAPQYYDGPNLATQAYVVPNVDTWVAMLGANRVVVGFGVWDQPNYMTIQQAVSTWNAVVANHADIGGAFDWQLDVDQTTGWPFAMQVGPLVNP